MIGLVCVCVCVRACVCAHVRACVTLATCHTGCDFSNVATVARGSELGASNSPLYEPSVIRLYPEVPGRPGRALTTVWDTSPIHHGPAQYGLPLESTAYNDCNTSLLAALPNFASAVIAYVCMALTTLCRGPRLRNLARRYCCSIASLIT